MLIATLKRFVFLILFMPLLASTVFSQAAYEGTFRGAGGKSASGNFSIFSEGGVTKIRLHNNFNLSRVPDPKIGFGNGRYKPGTLFVKLKKFRGLQTYVIPKRLNPSKYSQVWLWCEKFSVPLGVGSLKKR